MKGHFKTSSLFCLNYKVWFLIRLFFSMYSIVQYLWIIITRTFNIRRKDKWNGRRWKKVRFDIGFYVQRLNFNEFNHEGKRMLILFLWLTEFCPVLSFYKTSQFQLFLQQIILFSDLWPCAIATERDTRLILIGRGEWKPPKATNNWKFKVIVQLHRARNDRHLKKNLKNLAND